MNIHDYTDPTDPYAPRPRASQEVARARLERTAEAADAPAPPAGHVRAQLIVNLVISAIIVAGVILVFVLLAGSDPQPLATPARPFSPPAVTSPAPFSAPIAPTPIAQHTDVAQISVYAAPDGALLGPVEVTRRIEPVAHYGDGWVQADVAGSGLVWIRAGDMPGLAIVGPDLAPKAAPLQTGRGMGVRQQYVAPVAAPAEETQANGSKPAVAGDWCRGAHLDNPECAGDRGTK